MCAVFECVVDVWNRPVADFLFVGFDLASSGRTLAYIFNNQSTAPLCKNVYASAWRMAYWSRSRQACGAEKLCTSQALTELQKATAPEKHIVVQPFVSGKLDTSGKFFLHWSLPFASFSNTTVTITLQATQFHPVVICLAYNPLVLWCLQCWVPLSYSHSGDPRTPLNGAINACLVLYRKWVNSASASETALVSG